MLKRLIEVALPLKDISEQSAREKSIRHGHISTLHIWWARRPLAACRAVVFASLIPDPDDPECPASFKQLVMDVLGSSQFRPTQPEPSPGAGTAAAAKPIEDTPRNRCLEFIKHLVRWENSNNPEYIEPARKLIRAAHKILHPDSPNEMPKVLDPFAGGGSIPLEALRLGCEAHAIDINPVAHLIQLCTLVYPQKYGRPLPPDAPVPEYVREAADKGWLGGEDTGKQSDLWNGDKYARAEAEYRRNPLAADVKYWGNWVLEKAREELAEFYPPDSDGSVPVAYLWARTVKCPNPSCSASIPLVRQLWLCKKGKRKTALRMRPNPKTSKCEFSVADGSGIDFDPDAGTLLQGKASCPFCQTVVGGDELRRISIAGNMGIVPTCVVMQTPGSKEKWYRPAGTSDVRAYERASKAIAREQATNPGSLPDEEITPDRPSPNSRGLSGVVRYGIDRFRKLFHDRQQLALLKFVQIVSGWIPPSSIPDDQAKAVRTYLAMAVSKIADRSSTVCRWIPQTQAIGYTFGRQALPMVWDFVETNPCETDSAWQGIVDGIAEYIRHGAAIRSCANVARGSAMAVPAETGQLQAVITDPPYYDAVPYSDLSDFFYVWLKRLLAHEYPDELRTPLTPKAQELIAYYGKGKRKVNKTPEWYEDGMAKASSEIHRVLEDHGIALVMFAHKETSAWESAISSLNRNGLLVTSSWPLHTERAGRLVALDAAALASSVTLICRKRAADAGDGLWDDVRRTLREVANERLDFFWDQGIRGADFFISAIGPALSVFGRYERVVRLSGEEVTVGQFLDEVRDLVTHYALNKIIKGGQVGRIDAESQFYVVWKWSYGDAKVPADEAFKLAQALGFDTERMWDKTGVLEKSGQNVSATPIVKRMRIKNLGEPKADGTPASLIDVLHRLCAFRDKGDTAGAGEFLARSGHGKSEALWLVAQAVSEILPDGDKEKQLLQGLLNQRESLQRGESKLF